MDSWTKRGERESGRTQSAALLLTTDAFDSVCAHPAVLPTLQDDALIGGLAPTVLDGFDITFCDDVRAARGLLRKQNDGRENTRPAAALLAGFFHFYAYDYRVRSDVVCPRLGRPVGLTLPGEGLPRQLQSASRLRASWMRPAIRGISALIAVNPSIARLISLRLD